MKFGLGLDNVYCCGRYTILIFSVHSQGFDLFFSLFVSLILGVKNFSLKNNDICRRNFPQHCSSGKKGAKILCGSPIFDPSVATLQNRLRDFVAWTHCFQFIFLGLSDSHRHFDLLGY